MKLEKFKERNHKRIGIILFTIVCIMLITGVILYRTFAIFETNDNFNIIKGEVQGTGDVEFAFYVDGNISKNAPEKDSGYTLNTETSKCVDMSTKEQSSNISWNQEKWSAEIKNITTTKTKCYLYFDKLYVEEELNGAIPDLGNELVAVTFDETNGHAKKADLINKNNPWYKYSEQKWANAVILKNEEDYTVGEEIPEENIESYFVWIPRYRYQIWNGVTETSGYANATNIGNITDVTKETRLNKQKEIKIVFENKNDNVKTGLNYGDWLTHPAFTSFDSNGFWVGKFETSKNGNVNDDSISSKSVQIKPNVASWKNIKVANAFYTVYNYIRNLESHMMKNSEWGAVAYLAYSQYGRCLNGTCSEVRINNNSNYITGSSAVNEPSCGYTGTNLSCNQSGTEITIVNNYNNPASVVSSTTNNYYGIFDMAGGTFEYVMGVMLDQDGKPVSGRNNVLNSNFIGTLTCTGCDNSDSTKTQWTKEDGGYEWPDSRYYDTYAYATTAEQFQRGLFGDGTKEFGPFYQVTYNVGETKPLVSSWNADCASFATTTLPWFLRGGDFNYGTEGGITAFHATGGHGYYFTGFRVVLTP